MSGPIAGSFPFDPGLVLAASEIIRATSALREGYAAEAERQAKQDQDRVEQQSRRRAAALAGRWALPKEIDHEHTGARLLGASPGYIGLDAGGELTHAVRARP